MFIELLEMILSWFYLTLASMTPVPADSGVLDYGQWLIFLEAARPLLPPGCRTYEDMVALQVVGVWLNVLLDTVGSTLDIPHTCHWEGV